MLKWKKRPCLYLISSTSGHYKIGYSNDPSRRLKELEKTQGPYEYRLEYIWECKNEERARFVEGKLHSMYSRQRVNGEWFLLDASDLITIGSILSGESR